MTVHERQILLSTERAWNKEGVAWSQRWLPYHLPEGYSGVTDVQRQRQSESNQTPGISPRRGRRARAYIDITHALNSNIQLSLSLTQQFLFETFSCLKLNPYRTHFFLSFLAVQCSIVRIFLFLFTNLINYIKIWQIILRGIAPRLRERSLKKKRNKRPYLHYSWFLTYVAFTGESARRGQRSQRRKGRNTSICCSMSTTISE